MLDKKKGIVMEADSGTITILTSQGEFLSIPWSQKFLPEIGSEIEFTLPQIEKRVFQPRFLIALAASLVLFILTVPLLSGLLLPGSGQVVAFVSVDINPSIEFGINEKGRVLVAEGLNEDGIRLLENLKLINVEITEAVEIVASEAIKRDYLNKAKENNVVITVSNSEKVPEKVKNLDNSIKDILEKEKIQVEANLIEVTGDVHDLAKSHGVSTGKYVILMIAAEEENLELSIEDIKGSSIVKAVKEAGGIPGQLISKAKEHKTDFKDIQNSFEEKIKSKKQVKGDPKSDVGSENSSQGNGKKSSTDNDKAKNTREDRKTQPDEQQDTEKEKKQTEDENNKKVEENPTTKGEDDKESDKEEDKKEDNEEDKGNQGRNGNGKKTNSGGNNTLIRRFKDFLRNGLN